MINSLLKYTVLFFLLLFCSDSFSQKTKPLCTEVRMVSGLPALFIDGKQYPPFAYMSYLGEGKFYKEAAGAGIHLYNIPAYLGDRGINSSSGIGAFRPAIWVGEDTYDYGSISKDFKEIISADPDAKAFIRIHLDPPVWWEKAHPESACLLPDGSTYRNSFFSGLWLEEAGKALEKCIKWLLNSPYASHLAGIHVAGGGTEEWFYHYKDYFYDENPVRTAGFRKWLQNKYENSNDRLRTAWNNTSVSFSTASLADISGKVRRKEWRDPLKEQQVFDTFDFQAETMENNIVYFCRIVKKASKGCLLAGAFYGYHYVVTDPRRGHGALAKLLQCKDLDYLSSPNDYKRVAGEDWAPMAAIQSIQKHGKLWLAENDTRTSITTFLQDRAPQVMPPGASYRDGVWAGPKEMGTSVSFLWKNLARMLAYGYGGWWFDMWGGWFSDPALLTVLASAQKIFTTYPDKPEPAMNAQVCVIVDERLQFWDADFGSQTSKILGNRYSLAKAGSPYNLYLRTDLSSVDIQKYKVVWFMGIMGITEPEAGKIKELRKNGITVLLTDENGTEIYEVAGGKKLAGKFTWSAAELGALWETAGVHKYINTDDVLYAGRGWLSISTIKGGTQTVKLPLRAKVIDVIKQQVLAGSADSLVVTMSPSSTILWKVIPAQ